MGRTVFPPCCLTWGQTIVEVMKIMVISFKRSHARIAALSAPDHAAGHCRPTPPLETPGHSQASLGWSLVALVKAMVFPVVMSGYNSRKKAEHWRIDAFELRCWMRLLRAAWTARRSNQSILTEISPEYSLEGLMLKLKLQYFGHLMRRTDSLEKTLMLGKIEAGEGDDRGWDGWMASLTWWTWVLVSSRTGKPSMLQSMGLQKVRHDWATELYWYHVYQGN